MLNVTLYRIPGCGLCDQAEVMLARIAKRIELRVIPVDIEQDPDLLARYVVEIPVIAVGDNEVARAPISATVLEARLADLASPR